MGIFFSFYKFVFTCFWCFLVINFASDYALFPGFKFGPDSPIAFLTTYSQRVSIGFSILLLIIFPFACIKRRYVLNKSISLYILLLFIAYLTAGVVAFFKDVPTTYIFSELEILSIYFFIIPFLFHRDKISKKSVYFFFEYATIALLVKIIVAVVVSVLIFKVVSWRILFKQSSFFVFLFFFWGGHLLLKEYMSRKYLIYFGISLIGIFASQSRGFFFATGAAAALFLLLIYFCGVKIKILWLLRVGLFIGVVGLIYGYFTQENVSNSFGYWSNDSNIPFERGYNYRQDQSISIMNRFSENYMLGSGLGSFDKNWEGHEDWLPKPYLVELDLLNLFAKFGLVNTAIWLLSLGFFFRACYMVIKQNHEMQKKLIICGNIAGIAALFYTSFFQTSYSSIYFHFYIVLSILVLYLYTKSTKEEPYEKNLSLSGNL